LSKIVKNQRKNEKIKNPETLDFTGFRGYETRGIRTPDNLIKRQIQTAYLCGFEAPIPHRVPHMCKKMHIKKDLPGITRKQAPVYGKYNKGLAIIAS